MAAINPADNPAEVVREIAVDLASMLGCEVDHQTLDEWAHYCRQPPKALPLLEHADSLQKKPSKR